MKYESALNQWSSPPATLQLGKACALACTFGALAITRGAALPRSFASQDLQTRCFILCMKRFFLSNLFGAFTVMMAHGAPSFDFAAKATNEIGVDLYRQLATGEQNLCMSPYSIDSALAMTFAGADGETRTEMARVPRRKHCGRRQPLI